MLFKKPVVGDIRDPLDYLRRPFIRFTQIEASGGILLILATVSALLLANSQWGEAYETFWHKELYIGTDFFHIEMSLLHWLNDGLMAIFFFLIGLEIKRELLAGELSNFKQAILPFSAAIGGMVLPASIFTMLNYDQAGMAGWGIPMATDIAFALGIIGLLGKRVPLGLKVFLVAFAIIDDIGAVLVIALFYTSNLNWDYLAIATALLGVLIFFNSIHVRYIPAYMVVGWVIWYMFLQSGIHPSIAGVLIAFTIPAKRKIRLQHFSYNLKKALDEFSDQPLHDDITLNKNQLATVENIRHDTSKVQSPAQSLENTLHGFVIYVVMPLFAFANAGVVLKGSMETFNPLTLNISSALLFGKLLGILLFSYLAVKLGLASLPRNTTWHHIIGAGLIGGIGFTMSLFISNLAFDTTALLNQAKLGVLMGSLVASILGLSYLRFMGSKSYS